MTSVFAALNERGQEFETHYSFARALEDQIMSGVGISLGGVTLSARHLRTVKSGLLVHLYNIVEAVMSQVMSEVGEAVGQVTPSDWSEDTLREWLRKNAEVTNEGNSETRLAVIHQASTNLLKGAPLGPQALKKPSGTWDDKLIESFAKRLGVDLKIDTALRTRIRPTPRLGERSPMQFLAYRRNALAHGIKSFEEGAQDLTLLQIEELADTTLVFLRIVVAEFQAHVDNKKFVSGSA